MSAAKHTPGPWEAVGDSVYAGGSPRIAKFTTNWGHDVADANARLCAAAPELLAALERLTAACESSGVERSDIVAARAALAKVSP